MSVLASYSIRLLSPFQGTLQLIQTERSRALSNDGVNWQIQVLCRIKPSRWGSLDERTIQQRYARYGAWSLSTGISRLPLNPSVDASMVQQEAQRLVDELPTATAQLPLPSKDCHELWLTSRHDGLPVALLASSVSMETTSDKPALNWQPNLRGDRSFVAEGLGETAARPAHSHREALISLIMTESGSPPHAQWFRRDQSGDGIGLTMYPEDNALSGRELKNKDFPELLLRDTWNEESDTLLVKQFFAWQAHLLLTLPRLSTTTRGKLEPLACRHPLKVAAIYRLYPQFLDGALLKQTLVQAQLLKSTRI